METKEQLLDKIDGLIDEGARLIGFLEENYQNKKIRPGAGTRYMKDGQRGELFLWRHRIDYLIKNNVPLGNFIQIQLDEIRTTNSSEDSGLVRNFQERYALLKSFRNAIENNELDSWQYEVSAQDFSEFLDHARYYHNGNNKILSAVIAGVALEDTLKKIAQKNGVQYDGSSSNTVITALKTVKVINPSKAKILEGWVNIRNDAVHADHTKMEQYSMSDVGGMITGVEQLISDYLYPNP